VTTKPGELAGANGNRLSGFYGYSQHNREDLLSGAKAEIFCSV
jgi:hypothetical protein